ncbi:glycosyltransferase family A protein [Photobacterium toruni]|uniref:glycosyltransferase family A protein n=1 Tax=Photobacterium toruni TaxID=1935446 RepID=UPI0013564039|nr:glycosyltransferase family 2 protein [Photobacterium toruni]
MTATYNRSELLSRLHNSLINQTNYNFEWIIVDDGSDDDTKEKVEKFISTSKFSIKYVKQLNQGKHVAINKASEYINGEYVVLIDSDDELVPNAIETIKNKIQQVGVNSDIEDNKKNIIGFNFRCLDHNSNLLGENIIDEQERISTPIKMMNVQPADSSYVFNSHHFKNNKFPLIRNERFFPELYVWNKISDHGNIKYFLNTPICIVHYQQEGLSSNFYKLLKISPFGFKMYYKDMITRDPNFKNKLKYFVRLFQCYFLSIGCR